MTVFPPEYQSSHPLARVDLDLAGDPDLVRLARLAVSGVASAGGLTLEESEQCRAAVDELCTMLFELAVPQARIALSIVADGDRLLVAGAADRDVTRQLDPVRTRLGQLILDATVTEWSLDAESDPCRFWFCFDAADHRSGAPPGGEP